MQHRTQISDLRDIVQTLYDMPTIAPGPVQYRPLPPVSYVYLFLLHVPKTSVSQATDEAVKMYEGLLEGLQMHTLVGQFLVHFGQRFAREGRILREQIANCEKSFTERGIPIPVQHPGEPLEAMCM